MLPDSQTLMWTGVSHGRAAAGRLSQMQTRLRTRTESSDVEARRRLNAIGEDLHFDNDNEAVSSGPRHAPPCSRSPVLPCERGDPAALRHSSAAREGLHFDTDDEAVRPSHRHAAGRCWGST